MATKKTIAFMLCDGVARWRPFGLALSATALVATLALVARLAGANGADLPPQVLMQAFVKPEAGRLQLLVRIPLVLLGGFAFPKRGPGYLDLARIDDRLREASAAAARQIELFENGARLAPVLSESRVALPSDRSFESYAAARAHLQGPKLPLDTDLYANQGYLDVALEYAITSPRADFSVRVSVAPELRDRVTLHLEFLRADGATRVYDLPGASGRVPLDPRWYQAAWTFARSGFALPFALERLVFVACLAAPFRRLSGLLAVVFVLTVLQAASLSASGLAATSEWRLVLPLWQTCLAAAVVLLAIENVVAPSLRRRWFIASVVGVLGGFDVGHALVDRWQFAGAHPVIATVSFNVGVALAEVVALVLAFVALAAVFRYVTGKRVGVVVVSVVLGHMAWHWMLDSGHRLGHAAAVIGSTGALVATAWWVFVGLLVGGFAGFLPQWFDRQA